MRWGSSMRRARFHYPIAILTLVPFAALQAQAAEKALKVPAPVAADKDAIPLPEQKPTEAERKKSAEMKKKNRGKQPAWELFGVKESATKMAPRAIGWYAKGCLAGAAHLSDAGPVWQTMRPSRNRAWGHPKLIKLLKRLGMEAKKETGWPGLLVGDISQPRGGQMTSGHASHQVGLDADVWLTPMPDRTLTYKEREEIYATSMLDKTGLAVDPKVFTDKQFALIRRAASYRAVQRIFVHPAIKKALCERAGKNHPWLAKVRPLWGHYYHFHIRISCPNGGCRAQAPVSGDDGCGGEVKNWLKRMANQPPPTPQTDTLLSASRKITLNQLPAACRKVLDSPGVSTAEAEARGAMPTASAKK